MLPTTSQSNHANPPPQDAIKRLIEARFDAISGADQDPTPPSSTATPKRQANGHPASASDDEEPEADEIEVSTSVEPARKKQKRSESLDADAKLAAELQAQENQLGRARSTRGGGGAKVVKRKKKAATKKKSAKRVRGSDESEGESGGEGEVKKKRGGGFQKPFNLSEHLAELVGETQVSFCCLAPLRGEGWWYRFFPEMANADGFVALPPAGGQEAVGAHQGQRAAGPQGQEADHLRREDAGRVQAEQGGHVPDEQVHREPPVPGGRGVVLPEAVPPVLHALGQSPVALVGGLGSAAQGGKEGIFGVRGICFCLQFFSCFCLEWLFLVLVGRRRILVL